MDLNHLIGTDLVLAEPAADLSVVVDPNEGQQRVLRRLLTNPGAYVWHLDYGAGLARFIGQPILNQQISGTIKQQMKLEAAVVQSPPPQVSVSINPVGVVLASVQYIDAASQLTSALTIPLSQITAGDSV